MDPVQLAAQASTWTVQTPDSVLLATIKATPAHDKEEVLEIAEACLFYDDRRDDLYTRIVKACDMRARLDLVPYVIAQYLYIAKEEA